MKTRDFFSSIIHFYALQLIIMHLDLTLSREGGRVDDEKMVTCWNDGYGSGISWRL